MKRLAPAAERNREPIRRVLEPLLPPSARVLEIGSGTGQHVAYLTEQIPGLVWQPTDADDDALASIRSYQAEAATDRFLAPLRFDAEHDTPPSGPWSAVFSANVIHISPWAACEGVVRTAAAVLGPGGLLIFYGPFRFSGVFTAPSNAAFDARLRGECDAWGVRDVDDVRAVCEQLGFAGPRIFEMPANNHVLVFVRGSAPGYV